MGCEPPTRPVLYARGPSEAACCWAKAVIGKLRRQDVDAGEILKREPEDLHARCRGEQRAEAPVVSPGEFYSLTEMGLPA